MEEAQEPVVKELEFGKDTQPITHQWEQRGSDLVCTSCFHRHSTIGVVPAGMMLVMDEKGEYDFAPLT